MAWLMCWLLCWLMSCITFCLIRFSFDLHIHLMPKNSQHFQNSQPRTGVFFNGEFGPRRRPWPLTTWPPCFKYQPSPTMPSPEPLYGFKYSPWPSVSTLAMFEPFFKHNPFPIALFVAFWAKAHPTPESAPFANVWRTVFVKNGRAFAAKPAKNERNSPLFSYCEQPDVSSFLLWWLFHPDKLLSFCSLANSSKQEHHSHTNLCSRDECSRDSLYQRRVSVFAVDFQKFLPIHLCMTCLLYVIIFLSSGIWLSGFLQEDSIVFHFGLWQLFPFYWFYLKSLEDTQGFSGSQRFCNQVTRLERNCKFCFAFSHSHKTHQSHQHSRELNLFIRCWRHFAICEYLLCKPDF